MVMQFIQTTGRPPARKLSLIPRLEKLRAALGAAGMVAISTETVLRYCPGLLTVTAGHAALTALALLSALAAARFTTVSDEEARLKTAVVQEGTFANASGR